MKEAMIVRALLCILCLSASAMGSFAQSQPESASRGLLLQADDDTAIVAQGSKVSVQFRHDPRIFRNMVLEEVLDSAVVLSGDTVAWKYIDQFTVRDVKMYKAGKITLVLSIIATVGFFFSLALIFAFLGNPAIMLILGLVLVLFAIPMMLALPAGLIVGLVLMLVASRRYRLGFKWKISTPTTHIPTPHPQQE